MMSRQGFRPPALTGALVAACAILFVPLAIPLATGRVMPFGDLSAFHLPMRFLYHRALMGGDSFLWSSGLGSGLYLHGEGQVGMAHPFHLIIYRFLPLSAAFNIELLSSYLFCAAGMWLLLREFKLRSEAAAVGALTFAFSGFNLLHLIHMNAVAVLAHVPWSLYTASVLLATRDTRRAALAFAGAAAVLGSQLLLGFPQGVWITSVAIAWLVVYRLATGAPISRVFWLGAALACGFLIGAVQLVPTLDATQTSFRSATAMAFRLSFSLHPINLIQLWSPYTFKLRIHAPPNEWFPHEFGIYNGALSTLSVFWIAIRWRSLRDRGQTIAWLALAGLAVVLALGRYGGLYPLLAQVPGLSSFRASTRFIVLVHLAFGGLTALVVDDLLELQTRRERVALGRLWPLAASVAISLCVLAGGLLAAHSSWAAAHDVRLGGAGRALIGPGLALATALLIGLAARGRRGALAALIVLSALDLAAWGTKYAYTMRPVRVESLMPITGLPPGARRGDLVHPMNYLDDVNKYPMWHLRSTLDYLGLVQSTTLNSEDLTTMRAAGVRWTWTPAGWREVSDTMPRVRLVSDWRVSTNVPMDIPSVDLRRTALIDAPGGQTSGEPGQAEVVQERPGRMLIRTHAPAAQLLVVTERFHSGWRCTVGNEELPTRRVYGDYLGCFVPGGPQEISLAFAPASARWGLGLTLLGLIVTPLGAWTIRGRQSRIPQPSLDELGTP